MFIQYTAWLSASLSGRPFIFTLMRVASTPRMRNDEAPTMPFSAVTTTDGSISTTSGIAGENLFSCNASRDMELVVSGALLLTRTS